MAKEKLLCRIELWLVLIVLAMLSTSVNTATCLANAVVDNESQQNAAELVSQMNEVITNGSKDYLNLAKEIADQGRELALQSIIRKFKELKKDHGEEWQLAELSESAVKLQIFVSSSMPLNLLRTYHKQAINYGGVLVFKGLPGGSFQELTKLVMQISDGDDLGAMQIDDEVFNSFKVTSVPTIVLSKDNASFFSKSSKVIYDKIVGNIGIRSVLEKFAESGDLAKEARELLE